MGCLRGSPYPAGGVAFAGVFGWNVTLLNPFFTLQRVQGTARYAKYECLLSTSACVLAVLAGLFWPGLPNPHVDPTFIRASVGLAASAASAKAASFVWYVFPLTHGTADEPEANLWKPELCLLRGVDQIR